MAVQKNRKTRSKRDTRRAHDALAGVHLSMDPLTGEKHLPHHVSPDGYYKGRQVLPEKENLQDDNEE